MSFFPNPPNVNVDSNTFTFKGWFQAIWNYFRGLSGIAVVQTVAFVADPTIYFYACDTSGGAFAVTLPPAIDLEGKQFTIHHKAGAAALTVIATGSDAISPASSSPVLLDSVMTFISDGNATWYGYVPNSAGGGGTTITTKDEGAVLSATVTTLDFVGAGVTASGGGATTTVTIPGASNVIATQEEGAALSSAVSTLNFTGDRITASGGGATTTVAVPAVNTTKGDLLGFSSVEARVPVGPDGTVLTADSTATLGVSYKPDSASDRWSWVFGSGYDGSFHADGAAAMPGATRAGSVYTLTRTVSFTDLIVDSGVTIYVAGKGIVLVKDTLTLNGRIEGDGLLGRTPWSADFYTTQATGGGLATAGGSQGSALGGAGGAAGLLAGGGGVGGGAAGGAVTAPTVAMGQIAWSYLLQAILAGGGSKSTTGYGGGAAGGGGTGGGFPGGHGGGCCAVLARIIDSSSTGSITANGGNGTNATAANGGGGGGGGGGRAWLVTTTTAWASYIGLTANGGTGGNPNGTGNFGANGSAGTVASLILG